MLLFRRFLHECGNMLRETGLTIDRLGSKAQDNYLFREKFSRHRTVMPLFDKKPIIGRLAFVAPNASVIGDVEIHEKASVWYGAVLRADCSRIKIGHSSNVQDRAIIQSSINLATGIPSKVDIGDFVTIGHGAMLRACTINRQCLIGMGAVIMEGCIVEENCIIAAGSVLQPATFVPAGQLWAGNPARFVRNVTGEEMDSIEIQATDYYELAREHKHEWVLPHGTAVWEAEELAEADKKSSADPAHAPLVRHINEGDWDEIRSGRYSA